MVLELDQTNTKNCIANDTLLPPCFILSDKALSLPELRDAWPTCKWHAMFVNAREYNGFYASSLIYNKSRRFIHWKPGQTRCPCLYGANSSASCQILLRGGDISGNPGPIGKHKSAKCEECEKAIRPNHRVSHVVFVLVYGTSNVQNWNPSSVTEGGQFYCLGFALLWFFCWRRLQWSGRRIRIYSWISTGCYNPKPPYWTTCIARVILHFLGTENQ